jgi:subtilase family protein/GEVED domain-containing protein/type IX secretion system substrate protein
MSQTRTLLLPLFVILLLTNLTSRAQTVTNKTVLQQTGNERARQDAAMRHILLNVARQKNWPLTLRGKNGRLAYLMSIDAKGFPRYVTTNDNIISAATIRTNLLWPGGSTGLNLTGSSANMKSKIAIWDEGLVRPTHVELTGRVTQVDRATNLSDHSTHVSGTLIATGVNPLAKGMSNGAQQLQCYDFNNDISEMMTASGNGLLVSNHSYAVIAGWNVDDNGQWDWWGNPGDSADFKFGQYDSDTQMWDSTAWLAPQYLIVKAAGNNRGETGPPVGSPYYEFNSQGNFVYAGPRPAYLSSNAGYNIIATYGTAKNILTIGAVNPIPGGYNTPADVVQSDFSSWGPTSDGRIKPDLVADGVNVLSSISTADNAYDIYSGTSMASPASAGSSFLLQEYYSKLHSGAFMRSATLKGILIHTADEAGPAPGPDYQNGWGLIDMQKAASMITSNNTDQLIKEQNLVAGSVETQSFTVTASGKMPLVATICWTDPPATPTPDPTATNQYDRSLKLVNDLDLRITDATTGTTYYPWVLNPANPPAAATRGDNFRDNVEKVQVDSLVPGRTYTITITHKGVLARGSQAYSLLVSGVGGQTYCTSQSSGATGTTISNVKLSNINNANTAGCKTYSDFTALAAAQLPAGQTLPISINYQECAAGTSQTNIAVYIDFNNNGVFETSELVFQNNNNPLTSGATPLTLSGIITIPASVTPGTYSRMRIIAQDGTTFATPAPCGNYGPGETQDYRVLFVNPGNDVGITSLEYPTVTTCASDSQLVAVRIKNFGTVPQTSVPVTTTVMNGNQLVATFSAVCTDSIAVGSDVVFTYNIPFQSVAGATYTFTSTTSLAGDDVTSNNQNITTLTVNAAAAPLTGSATLCSLTATQVGLTANVTGNDLAVWYATPTSTTPIAVGNNTSTSVITPDNTYYLGVNGLNTKAGPANKLALSGGAGAYFRMQGNFFQFTTHTPLTIESAKMYIGYSGQISLTLATLVSYTDQDYSYYPIYNTVIDVHPTTQHPDTSYQVNVAAGDNSDTGAVFLLNIPVPTPGNYIILINCLNYTSAFVNANIPSNPYPFTLPGVIDITGNDFRDYPNADSITYFQKFYFPFYNLGIRLPGCPGPRTAIKTTSAVPPTIVLNGKVFSSTDSTGNQWLLNGAAISGANSDTLTGTTAGVYQTMVTDPATGCTLYSNKINFNNGGDANASIGLTVTSNPNPGVFQLQFYFPTTDNLNVSMYNALGQRVYSAAYPDFTGTFYRQMDMENLASGVYVLKIIHGNNSYIQKIIIKK